MNFPLTLRKLLPNSLSNFFQINIYFHKRIDTHTHGHLFADVFHIKLKCYPINFLGHLRYQLNFLLYIPKPEVPNLGNYIGPIVLILNIKEIIFNI